MPVALLWRALGWTFVLAVVVFSLLPGMDGPQVPQGDKLNHILAYALLMNWFAQIDLTARRRVAWALGLLALGIALEFAQSHLGWRMYDPMDMIADAVGIALGWLAAPPRGFDAYGRLRARFA